MLLDKLRYICYNRHMKIQKAYILIGIFALFTYGHNVSACTVNNPCGGPVAGQTTTPPTGPTQTPTTQGVYVPQLPQVYGNNGELITPSTNTNVSTNTTSTAQPTTTVATTQITTLAKPDYSYISPVIVNQNGSTTSQLSGQTTGGSSTSSNTSSSTTNTQTSSSTTEDTSNNGIFGGGSLFGGTKNVFSSGNSNSSGATLDQNLKATVASKGLAMGSNTTGSCSASNVDHVVLYKNITGQVITNVAVRVSLPDGVEPTGTNTGSYSARDNTITYFIGTLNPDQEGQIYINGKRVSSATNSNVARSEFVYTLPDQNQNMVVAYAFGGGNCTGSSSALGASALGSGTSFFGGTLLGWLFLALLVAACIYLVRFFLSRPKAVHNAHAH